MVDDTRVGGSTPPPATPPPSSIFHGPFLLLVQLGRIYNPRVPLGYQQAADPRLSAYDARDLRPKTQETADAGSRKSKSTSQIIQRVSSRLCVRVQLHMRIINI
ncbi:hypothetical protein SK128_020766 [Halocaridina rubra]|uniref:Uncharacterized protein n=1 Tax=Halocaridina rubra TaxID=373956 RepID=A0AAN8ZXF7_HALRR